MVEMELEEIRLNMSYEVLYITILHFIHKYIYSSPKDKFLTPPLQKPLWIQGTLVNSRLFLKANVFCFLFFISRHVMLLDASATCINIIEFKNYEKGFRTRRFTYRIKWKKRDLNLRRYVENTKKKKVVSLVTRLAFVNQVKQFLWGT